MEAITSDTVINFSEILKKFITLDCLDNIHQNIDDFDVMVEGFNENVLLTISNSERKCEIFFEREKFIEERKEETYTVFAFCSTEPLSNYFTALISVLRLKKAKIILDVMEFEDNMFTESVTTEF